MQRESLKYYTRRYKRAGREGKKGKDGEREKMRPPPLSAKEEAIILISLIVMCSLKLIVISPFPKYDYISLCIL